ncbi:MAG: ATP-grasp domain-containing protein [Bacteroidales bacterium]|nr:ATP-grasp domain-containing protein [Bacteroidales bacterium]
MNFKGKKLLVLGGIKLLCDVVIRAKALGAYVIVADYNENSPAKQIADEGVLINALDVDSIVSYCKEYHVDGVITGFVDILLKPYYEVCKRLGLPCYLTSQMIEISTNKIAFKETCKQFDVPVPETYIVGSEIPEEEYNKIKFPVFLKPLDSSGSRGAYKCNNKEELHKRFYDAIIFSPSRKVIIEDYLTGREFLMNFIAQDGEFRMISMFDRHVTDNRGSAINYANLSFGPSKATDYYLNLVNDKVINMFKSLNFKDGIYFLQGYYDNNKITFYEMGCRLGGSYYDLENAVIKIDPINMLINYAFTGVMIDNIQDIREDIGKYDKIAVCVNYLLAGKEGTVYRIKGIDKIKQMGSYVHCEQRYEEGYHYNDGDKVVDRPLLCVYLMVQNFEQLVHDVDYMNNVFDVLDKNNNSLLQEKFNPLKLVKY